LVLLVLVLVLLLLVVLLLQELLLLELKLVRSQLLLIPLGPPLHHTKLLGGLQHPCPGSI
jgi:hypothetical protein